MQSFWQALQTQRWDDHRYYHHSRINQSLHLVSALGFLCAYLLLFVDPAGAALIGWMFAIWGSALYWWAAGLYVVQARQLLAETHAGPASESAP